MKFFAANLFASIPTFLGTLQITTTNNFCPLWVSITFQFIFTIVIYGAIMALNKAPDNQSKEP